MAELSTFTLSVEAQYDIFHPLLLDKIKKMTIDISTKVKMNLSDAEWTFVSDERTAKDFSRPFVLDLDWNSFEKYFKKEQPLFVYLQQPLIGMVNKPAVFWTFFDPKIVHTYWFKKSEKPKDFNGKMVLKLPFVELRTELVQLAAPILESQDDLANKLKKLETFYAIADHYLTSDENAEFDKRVRPTVLHLVLMEIEDLLGLIDVVGMSPSKLEKRLAAIFRITVRLYAMHKGDKEREGLKKLLAPSTFIRKKALELIYQKVAQDIA